MDCWVISNTELPGSMISSFITLENIQCVSQCDWAAEQSTNVRQQTSLVFELAVSVSSNFLKDSNQQQPFSYNLTSPTSAWRGLTNPVTWTKWWFPRCITEKATNSPCWVVDDGPVHPSVPTKSDRWSSTVHMHVMLVSGLISFSH